MGGLLYLWICECHLQIARSEGLGGPRMCMVSKHSGGSDACRETLACIVETGMYVVPDEVATSLPIPWCYMTDFVSLPIISSWNNLLSCVEVKNGESPIFIRLPEVLIILVETQ